MAVGSLRVGPAAHRSGIRVRELLDHERFLGPAFITPALLLITLLVAYPFCMALYFALSNAFIGRPSHFIGIHNFVALWDSDAFRQTFQNSFVFTASAVGLKLVDGLGNEKTALTWLEKEKKVPANTPVRDYSLRPRFSELSFLHVTAWTFQAVGLSAIAHRIEEWGAVQAVERLNLDGLLALWHPPSTN